MTGKILVVEDDDVNRRLFVSLLNEQGYDVLEAVDGEEAIKAIEEESPSLILLDLMIPKINGLAVFRDCRDRGLLDNKKVYALTAAPTSELLDEGFNGIISKPVRIMEFLETVGEALKSFSSP